MRETHTHTSSKESTKGRERERGLRTTVKDIQSLIAAAHDGEKTQSLTNLTGLLSSGVFPGLTPVPFMSSALSWLSRTQANRPPGSSLLEINSSSRKKSHRG